MKNEIIDSEELLKIIQQRNEVNNQVIKWWETKRIYYSIAVLLTQIVIFAIYGIGPSGMLVTIILSFFYLIAANAIYTASWGTELLINYYFKRFSLNNSIRWIMFIGGVLFSIGLTSLWYIIIIT